MKKKDDITPERTCPYITKEACDARTRSIRYVGGLFMGVLSVFLALVVYASSQASNANANYNDMVHVVNGIKTTAHEEVTAVQVSLDKHMIAQTSSDKVIIERLDELKREVSAQRQEQKDILDKILELQIEVAKKYAVAVDNP